MPPKRKVTENESITPNKRSASDQVQTEQNSGVSIQAALALQGPSTLKELSIDRPHMTLQVDQIIMLCPQLETLFCNAKSINVSSVLETSTQLQTLQLYATEDIVINAHFGSILQHSPNLLNLKLGSTNADILPVLDDHCPSLINIVSNTTPSYEYDELPEIYGGYGAINESSLVRIVLKRHMPSPTHLRALLEKNQCSLRTLQFVVTGNESLDDWRSLSNCDLPNLTRLEITCLNCFADDFMRDVVPAMIRSYFSLQALVLSDHTSDNHRQRHQEAIDAIFNAAPILYSLHRLQLDHFDIRGKGFSNFLRHHIWRGQTSLERLTLDYCPGINAQILKYIVQIRTIGGLGIRRAPGRKLSASSISFFTRGLRYLIALSKLDLGGFEINEEDAGNILACQRLEEVNLHDYPGQTTTDAIDLLRRNIRTVTVRSALTHR